MTDEPATDLNAYRDTGEAEADERVDEIADRFLAALQAGATLDRGVIVAQHPDLGDRLDRRLKVIERLHRTMSDSGPR